MDWTNNRDDADAIDAAAAMERRIAEGRHRPFHAGLFGGLDFLTLGHGANAGALRNHLDPGAGAPATQGEVARLRQQSPWAYYGGQGLTGAGMAMAGSPAWAALGTGAAIYNAPPVQRTARDLSSALVRALMGQPQGGQQPPGEDVYNGRPASKAVPPPRRDEWGSSPSFKD